MKRGEIVVHMGNYTFTKFHQNQMNTKKVLLIARFSVQNFKVSVELWKSYIVPRVPTYDGSGTRPNIITTVQLHTDWNSSQLSCWRLLEFPLWNFVDPFSIDVFCLWSADFIRWLELVVTTPRSVILFLKSPKPYILTYIETYA